MTFVGQMITHKIDLPSHAVCAARAQKVFHVFNTELSSQTLYQHLWANLGAQKCSPCPIKALVQAHLHKAFLAPDNCQGNLCT